MPTHITTPPEGERGRPAYYNEIDPYAAQWLRNLIGAGEIAPGDVDERSIEDVRAADLAGYAQCHFFAGIGGWSLALRLAGWDDARPVWTGSCPCQPFSSASRGRGRRTNSNKHLWPHWHRLIAACHPADVFGEQVAGARDWLDEVWRDLEESDYTVRPVILPAGAVGADHIRERIWFHGHADRHRESRLSIDAEAPRVPWRDRQPAGVVSSHGVSADVAALRAFGNAIAPQVAQVFIEAVMEAACAPPPPPQTPPQKPKKPKTPHTKKTN
jgi:DNA (cytosine-5)-methyltransferase 1